MTHQSIYLVGLMAVGKSTVGKLLAERLNRPFFDSDKEIERKAGAEISWIFDVEGEEGFRDREEQVIYELTKVPGVVVATGGGAVLREENRQMLTARGCVVHLDSPLERLLERYLERFLGLNFFNSNFDAPNFTFFILININ